MAAALTYAPGASLATLITTGAPLAALAIALTALATPRETAAGFTGYPMRYTTLWLPALLAAAVLGLHQARPDWSVLGIICLLAPGIAIVVSATRHGGSLAPLVRHVQIGLPAMANELLLFLAAGLLAGGLAALLATFDDWLPFTRYGSGEAVVTLLLMWGLAMLGVHPVIGVAVLGTLIAPIAADPSLLAMTFLAAWATSVPASPFSGMNLALQGRYDIPPLGFLRWNGLYGLVMLAAASGMFVLYEHLAGG
jgi:hypothetical protein